MNNIGDEFKDREIIEILTKISPCSDEKVNPNDTKDL